MEVNDNFIKRLNELHDLYVESKRAIILLENYNREQKTFIAPLNEMRNALDHVMKMVLSKDDEKIVYEQYRGARSHIRRAGYDAFELLCISHTNYIKDILKDFSPSDISNGFPQYYATVKPKIHEIQGRTAEYRERKEKRKQEKEEIIDDAVAEKDEHTYEYYFEAYECLDSYVKKLDYYIPPIVECKKKREEDAAKKDKKAARHFVYGIIVTVIVGVLGYLATVYF